MIVKRAGLALIVIGIVIICCSAFTYIKHRSQLDSGAIKPQTEAKHSIRLYPLAGAALLIGGILLLGRDFKVHT